MHINIKVILYILSLPILLMGGVQLCFALLSLLVFHDHTHLHFFESSVIATLIAGLTIIKFKISNLPRINYRDSLLITTLIWVFMGVFGALPIHFISHVSITDSVFESISALTTTGATVLSNLDNMPPAFLMYRQFLQWLGGLGVVIFVVAILPMLNIGGMKLLKSETPGPIKDEKITPRITNTARFLWVVYVVLTLLCALCYYLAGMSLYDAIAHSFTTVSTGGFSTHDASMGYFNSNRILAVSNIFMLLGAISFALHFKVAKQRTFSLYWQNEEVRTFLLCVLILTVLITLLLVKDGSYHSYTTAFNTALFHLISFITSTGYGADNFTAWSPPILLLLLIAGYLGGCTGSTAGGNKIIRSIISIKIVLREMHRLIHPHRSMSIKYQSQAVDINIINTTIAFMTIAAITSIMLTMILMLTGLEFWPALSAVASCLNVSGPAFGNLSSSFQPVTDTGTWILSGAMILGRLEYFTVLALFLPRFWMY